MNAFLTARELKLPFNSYEEILDSDLDTITFKESSNEEYFKSAPKGSILRRMFDEKISKDPGALELGYAVVRKIVLNGKAVYAGDLETLLIPSENRCLFTDISRLR